MKVGKRKVLSILAIGAVLSAYPIFVLGFTWFHVARSDLRGGKNGPLDAYRHTLASAVVAYTFSPKAVEITTRIMESRGRSANLMDQHNNRLGARLGSAAGSFSDIDPLVRAAVSKGRVASDDPDQVTWLPEDTWEESWLW